MASQSATLDTTSTPAKPRRNWWKVAFFALLIAFEFVREWAVLASAAPASPSVVAMVYSTANYAHAQGRWKRIDGGDRLVPGIVTIQCFRNDGRCIETNVTINDKYVWTPDTSLYAATFLPDAVTYEKGDADCAKYTVRLDLKLEKAFSVRERKANAANPMCADLERRIEMQLSDGYDEDDLRLEDHFVPMFQMLSWLSK